MRKFLKNIHKVESKSKKMREVKATVVPVVVSVPKAVTLELGECFQQILGTMLLISESGL